MDRRLAHSMFHYKRGKLYWKDTMGSRALEGIEAGSVTYEGYRRITVARKEYRTHRLIFLMHHGYMPEIVDHINGVRDDNRIENLRAATINENCYNCKLSKSNKSGVKGVYWVKGRDNSEFVKEVSDAPD